MAKVEQGAAVRVERPRCPFCHDQVAAEDEKHGCPSCMAWHHAECWDENAERCSACGHGVANAPIGTDTAVDVEAVGAEPEDASSPGSLVRGAMTFGVIVTASVWGFAAFVIVVAILRGMLARGGVAFLSGALAGLVAYGVVVLRLTRTR